MGGNVTRVLASDLDALSSYLSSNFKYDTGPYQDYSFEIPAKRYLAKLDYNLNDRNKISVRYLQLDSESPTLLSNSSSLGRGTRRSNTTGLNFANSNYAILENIKSGVGEWNSIISSNMANSLIVGYTTNDESRPQSGELFPFVDILNASTVYTSFGFEPFTPNNELRYHTFQVQDNFTWSRGSHTFTFGGAVEQLPLRQRVLPRRPERLRLQLARRTSTPTPTTTWPTRTAPTTSPVTLSLFQVRWNNIPGQEKPLQPLDVWYGGLYAQDEWQAARNFKVTYGVRMDVSSFGDTGFQNADADALTFRDADGSPIQYQTAKLPDAKILWSPRVGFNWDVNGNRQTQVRGGTGVFTGPPIYVWISNQVGNTGVLTGYEELRNTKARPWNPNPNAYKPTNVTGAPASSYQLALTDPDFKFPQVWRSNIAVDQRLPWDLIGTAEFIYSRDVNGISYIQANLPAAQTSFVGADTRPRWTSRQINPQVTDATVLGQPERGLLLARLGGAPEAVPAGLPQGRLQLRRVEEHGRPRVHRLRLLDRQPDLGRSQQPPGRQLEPVPGQPGLPRRLVPARVPEDRGDDVLVLLAGLQQRREQLHLRGRPERRRRHQRPDLHPPRHVGDELPAVHVGAVPFTAAEQAAAWDAYINQDSYLSKRRGPVRRALRGASTRGVPPRLQRGPGHLQEPRRKAALAPVPRRLPQLLEPAQPRLGRRPAARSAASPSPTPGVDAQGRATYRLRVVNNQLMNKTWETTAFSTDVYQIQFSLRYTFN